MARNTELTIAQLLEALRNRRSQLLALVSQIDSEIGNESQARTNGMGGNKTGGRKNGKASGRKGRASASKEALLTALKAAAGGLTKEELKKAVHGADLRALRFETSVKKKGNRYMLA